MKKKPKEIPAPAPLRCTACGDRLDQKYIIKGWAIGTHPAVCPARLRRKKLI